MASNPALTSEAIALTEKKMDMTLDDIIKMSKKSSSKAKNARPSNKSRGSRASRGNSSKMQSYIDSRSSVRQGALAQRRSNNQGAQFPLAKEAARKAAAIPLRNRVLIHNRVNWNRPRGAVAPVKKMVVESDVAAVRGNMVLKQRPQTLDSLFANMKEQRMRALSQQQIHGGQNNRRQGGRKQQQRQRGRDSGANYDRY